MMNTTELREKSEVELKESLEALLKEQFSLRMQKGVGQLNQSHLLKNVRRDIARINTVMNEKKRAEV